MTEKEKILGRIREALVLSAPLPGHHEAAGGAHAGETSPHHAGTGEFRTWLPVVGDDPGEQVRLFAGNSEALKTEFAVVADESELAARLAGIARREGWTKAGVHDDPLVNAAIAELPCETMGTDGGYETMELEACDAGISGCDFLVAQTGSVIVTAKSAGGRALSVLPPHHVVVARIGQLLPDLPAAFDAVEERYAPDYPSFLSVITGPSRTGDIERILVLGAHGPRQLTVLLVEDGGTRG